MENCRNSNMDLQSYILGVRVRRDIDLHIENFPSAFDNTDIAKMLIQDGVSVRTYADTRHLWNGSNLVLPALEYWS